MGRILWASSLLLPVLTANALIFELPSFAHHKRASRHHELSRKTKRAPTLPATWSAYGCVSDGPVRTLTAVVFDSDTMTVETCVNYCDSHNYRIAGLEYSRECYCDNDLQNGATTTTGCDMLCNGDNTQTCGGGYKLSVYRSSKTGPAPLQTYNNWGYQGCYTDTIAARTLPVGMAYAGSLTPQKCIDACASQNYNYAGLEYSVECYCGNGIANDGALTTSDGCNMICAGSNDYLCGGGNRLTVYQRDTAPIVQSTTTTTTTTTTSTSTSTPATTSTTASTSTTNSAAPPSASAWTSVGCYTDAIGTRTLSVPMGIAGMTPEKCQAACQAANYVFAGVEYGAECYCGAYLNPVASPATDGRCNMPCGGDATQSCGGPNGIFVYQRGEPEQPPAGPSVLQTYGDWAIQGCFLDSAADRSLPVGMGITGGPGAMSVEACCDACQGAGYSYSGLEYSGECFCGNTITAPRAIDNRCNMPCYGKPTEICGGPNGLTVYELGGTVWQDPSATTSTSTSSSTPVQTQTSTTVSTATESTSTSTSTSTESTSTSTSTSSESTSEGTSTSTSTSSESTSTSTSTSSDSTSTSTSTSTSSSSESTSSSTESSTSTESTSTSTSSSTSSTPTPTGPSFLQSYGNWESQGCWSDNPGARSLPVGINMNGVTTPQKCMDACYNAGYNYAGMEYAAECYCGTEVLNGGSQQTDDGCNMLCNADPMHYCGGPFRLNMYKYNGVVPPSTNPPGGDPAPVGDIPPLTTGLPNPWRYSGCWVDNAHGRILPFAPPASANNSPLTCIQRCVDAGYTVAGMEYSQECYCGNSLINAATKAGSDAQCNMGCSGDNAHACGGANRITLYSTTDDFPVYPVPDAKTENLPGHFEYVGCYSQPGGGQLPVFQYQIIDFVGTTVDGCLNKCSLYGYSTAGLMFGRECYCGDMSDVTTKGGAPAAEGDCNIPCTGTPVDTCGGVERYNLYTWSTTNPLYVWNEPANKGHYELLIGGVVIPLIATLGINNKVNFMEKYGTGAPNSTGAYELDYSLANDFGHAWREMHVSSDVFCAANIVLPDRKGRVLSVGGWSFESTQGVRFYTPDGSPGVNGTNDWEEHWDQIHLQQGRWYPGAMVMANGSILIVGGEEGSNGAPVPSLEVLPKPEGGPTYLTMDWLLRTDPNNLYPFLYVLPGKGIFIIYFNEARILDEKTFETIKTFPIIPGAVTGPAGRVYPLEGSSMILPQHAPYTDPVEILTCGGSAFGLALDNCVSIEPEGAGEWIIERMPSKRVMTITTALPDGTYMIMGGAKAGVAGFGLANTPNLQAIMYDPSKPRHQRFSILGETSVARMYHSEAILLHDGRVLVTGSDPQDQLNPQEYRMEVYVPPYLTDGRVQPSYTIVERDWVFEGTYNIQVTLPQGPISQMRVSLVGASSTTHGATYGQRTFFPAFSCNGNSCQVTAPPGPYICPPGWYMLFILDGPTPSHSQWVRIGGDIGNLGSWPNTGGFVLPGMGGIEQ